MNEDRQVMQTIDSIATAQSTNTFSQFLAVIVGNPVCIRYGQSALFIDTAAGLSPNCPPS